nr:hypothetical protein [Pandoravirus aubagnensis]
MSRIAVMTGCLADTNWMRRIPSSASDNGMGHGTATTASDGVSVLTTCESLVTDAPASEAIAVVHVPTFACSIVGTGVFSLLVCGCLLSGFFFFFVVGFLPHTRFLWGRTAFARQQLIPCVRARVRTR